jgi:hypothetical protein
MSQSKRLTRSGYAADRFVIIAVFDVFERDGKSLTTSVGSATRATTALTP